VRSALLRHLEKDLGPLALPKVPLAPQPFTIAEYFPTPGVTPFHDPRQHAVSLAYVVPVEGDCAPQQDALELTWFSPAEARDERLLAEMTGGQGTLLQQALAYMGH
jgi:ADP-ribose pyrophosphatase YjhB (NUDIX family)